jgi:hypothetical protein
MFKKSKLEEATGAFWGASLFIGVFIAVIIGFKGNGHSDWLFAGIAGVLSFLILGLLQQGAISLIASKADKLDKPE